MTQAVDSTTGVSDANGQPTQTQGAQQVQQNSPDVDAKISEALERHTVELERKFQSIKDRRISELMKGIDELKQMMAGEGTKQEPAPTPQGTATATNLTPPVQEKPVGKQVDFDEAEAVILKQFGLSNDDPAVVAAKALDPVLRIVEYGKIVERRNEKANLAAATAVGGGAPVGKDALADELMKLQQTDPFDKSGRQAAIMQQLGIT